MKSKSTNRFILATIFVWAAYSVFVISVFTLTRTDNKLPVYWEISSSNQFRGYVVPSIHLSKFSYRTRLGTLLNNVDAVALEINLGEFDKKIGGFNLTGGDLENILSKEAVAYYRNLFGGQEWNYMKTLKPAVLSSYVDNFLAQKGGAVNEMDRDAFEEAVALNKKVVGLEDIESQAGFLLENDTDSIKSLETVANNQTEYMRSFGFVEEIYQKGDVELMRALYNLDANGSTETKYSISVRDPILQRRSAEELKNQKTLIIVGFAHVPGIIDKLKMGFDVKEVNSVRK